MCIANNDPMAAERNFWSGLSGAERVIFLSNLEPAIINRQEWRRVRNKVMTIAELSEQEFDELPFLLNGRISLAIRENSFGLGGWSGNTIQ